MPKLVETHRYLGGLVTVEETRIVTPPCTIASAALKPGYYWVETSAGVEIGLWDATSWRFCAGEPREQFDHTCIKVWSERLTPPPAAIAS